MELPENTTPQPEAAPPKKPKSFLDERVHGLMKLKPEHYTGDVIVFEKGKNVPKELPHYTNVFETVMVNGVPQNFEAIAINFTDIEGRQVYLDKGGKKGQPYQQLRWKDIPTEKHAKYQLPAGNGTRPFFPQYVKMLYQGGMQYEHLVLTEGAFKADLATVSKILTVGLTSITHSADKDFKDFLHADIIKVLEVNRPKRVTIVWDGDCRNISHKDVAANTDLNRRPAGFYKATRALKERLRTSGYTGEIWFACPRTVDLKDEPKGLDDLLLSVDAYTTRLAVQTDLESNYEGDTQFFHKLNISTDITRLTRFFLQDGVDSFYNHHRNLIKEAAFTWEGSKYQFEPKDGRCIRLLSREMKEFMRVGDTYYRKYQRPDARGQFDEIIEPFSRATIVEDYGKYVLPHIPKYKSFVVRPDHFSHTPVIHDCYNRYHPFTHQQEECDIEEFERNSTTFKYIRHVFGPSEEHEMPDHTGLFLDYFKLLYEQPTEKLPAICLVSRERNTGKSTLLRWLRMVYGMNMIVIGNQTLNDQFNGTWAGKLLIGIDEALIEKVQVLEMIKSLMTEQKAVVRRMQKEGVPEDFFAKFIFNSNNVLNFILADKNEDRFWIRYVPSYGSADVDFEKKLYDEIPQFLYYIAQRQMQHKKESRFWFNKQLYLTTAFEKVAEASRSHTEKNLEEALEKQFNNIPNASHLHFTKKELADLILNNVGEREHLKNIRNCLVRLGYPDTTNSISYTRYELQAVVGTGMTWVPVEADGRAYKFVRGKGIEMFAPAKEKKTDKP